MPNRTWPRTAACLAALTLAASGLTACSKEGPDGALKDFLAGWRSGNLNAVGFVAADGGKISAESVVTQLQELSGDLAKQPLVLSAAGEPKTTGNIASSTIKLDWTLPGGAPWSYNSTVRLTKEGSDGWRVIWEPAIVQSELAGGDRLGVRRVAAVRAPIQDAKGTPIVTPRDVVVIGVTPEKIKNLGQLQKDLQTAFKEAGTTVDMSNLADRVKNADAGAFIELITLRRTDYDKIRGQVRPLAGTVFREEKRELAPSRAFARALLGSADQATREDIDANPEAIAQGDIVGHGGLQQRYDTQLRGTAGVSVVISRVAADGTASDTQLYSTKPVDGKPIKLTLDAAVQNAADAALATQKQASSLVAIKVSDGAVLAVANGPDGGAVNTALTGQVAPGSTFKAVSTYGLLQKKLVTADTVVPCPRTRTVNGREFRNSNNSSLGRVQFHTDFAKSCNTAFVELAPKLGAAGLAEAATALGLGGQWDMGIESFSGKVSPAGNPTELAAATFGQGTTTVSPVAMASVAAAIARGQFKQPKLVLEPAPTKAVPDGPQLDAGAVQALRAMMREVVTSGTGTALGNVEGKPVSGKTGTAEFDNESKDTHSWFIGFQGDVAFAVMVQKGGSGAEAAVPVVETFLNALNK
ncbi:penicillin-binding transpeptidase domain-containing protein [Paractinoplanes rishiriensis]|uniref:Cell division protein FtsI n=1 Tax=Paractinoplanes rishiriensis TaxID=1050105 RepID=A0A919JVA5_9ACTN|nr:penicillin-binding transpeptidase domain-containing protein [Actinoplanes rishiriensis]GIE93798.1 cell division protein FtsI [Actinoplanes rishiriensis]